MTPSKSLASQTSEKKISCYIELKVYITLLIYNISAKFGGTDGYLCSDG